MKEMVFVLSILSLIACAVILLIGIPKYQIRGIQIESLLRENRRLKRDSRRYELIKAYGTTSKFLGLLSQSSFEDIDEFILNRVRNCFRDMLSSNNGFLSAYLFIETLDGKMKDLLKKHFLELFRDRGSLFRGISLSDSIVEKGQPVKNAIEKTIADIGDSDFTRKCYFHAAERLSAYIAIQLGDIVDADFKTELQNELKRIKTLTV